MKHVLPVLGLVLAVSASATTPPKNAEAVDITKMVQSGNLMPPVVAPKITTTFMLTAISTGCTDSKDFSIEVVEKPNHQELTVVRKTPDLCETTPRPETFKMSTNDLAIAESKPIRVMNPELVEDNFVR